MSSFITQLQNLFDTLIVGSPIWAGLGLATVVLVALFIALWVLRAIWSAIRSLRDRIASRRRKSRQGFGIAVSPFSGSRGTQQTKALLEALDTHFEKFSFGSPFEILKAPHLVAKGRKGLRAHATDWLDRSGADLIVWGYRAAGKTTPLSVSILSLEGSLKPNEAALSEGYLPLITKKNKETTAPVSAYLIARALHPGLADATAFKVEKLVPVAELLSACLQDQDALPERTQLTLENDYCAMALHIGGEAHLTKVTELRRQRLSLDETRPFHVEVQSRIDLGRALLELSNLKFDPVRVREAMDHLKVAVDLLKEEPVLRLANATAAAVQQGQTMLENRQRFSVTGGSGL